MTGSSPRHVLGISGGKDSAALALHMRDRIPQMEYYFCDTGKELPETYEFVRRLEIALGRPVARLNAERDFDHWLWVNNGMLPSSQVRWCTRQLKIRPFEEWIGADEAISYIGIRADEDRDGYISPNSNITAVYPFKEDGITKADVFRILDDAGVGLPEYYSWRSRSGCFFCFFQRKYEWVRLAEKHPDLFQQAIDYEQKVNYQRTASGDLFTWAQGETLTELIGRREQILSDHESRVSREHDRRPRRPLLEVLEAVLDEDGDATLCTACHW
jgi:3'-phosphoadenosine 5'-phosphosulfate sulfotransferase (PAPS reductase)/FAD synthetase